MKQVLKTFTHAARTYALVEQPDEVCNGCAMLRELNGGPCCVLVSVIGVDRTNDCGGGRYVELPHEERGE